MNVSSTALVPYNGLAPYSYCPVSQTPDFSQLGPLPIVAVGALFMGGLVIDQTIKGVAHVTGETLKGLAQVTVEQSCLWGRNAYRKMRGQKMEYTSQDLSKVALLGGIAATAISLIYRA